MDVRTSVFALRCSNNGVYILSTQNASLDLEHFRQGTGAPFCTNHPFESVLQIALTPEDPIETARVMAAEYRTQGKTVTRVCHMWTVGVSTAAALPRLRPSPLWRAGRR